MGPPYMEPSSGFSLEKADKLGTTTLSELQEGGDWVGLASVRLRVSGFLERWV